KCSRDALLRAPPLGETEMRAVPSLVCQAETRSAGSVLSVTLLGLRLCRISFRVILRGFMSAASAFARTLGPAFARLARAADRRCAARAPWVRGSRLASAAKDADVLSRLLIVCASVGAGCTCCGLSAGLSDPAAWLIWANLAS